MKTLVGLLFVGLVIHHSEGLSCWECNNAKTNSECIRKGKLTNCNEIDAICEDQIRHERDGSKTVIEKRCKQAHACQNNVIQNLRPAFPIQCHVQGEASVCRCCCSRNGCNRNLLRCWSAYPRRARDEGRNCPRFPAVPENGNMQCNGNREPGTTCDYKCHTDYAIRGQPKLTCLSNGKWNYPIPRCELKSCQPEEFFLEGGTVTCSNKNYLGSRCDFKCNENSVLIGRDMSTCFKAGPNDPFGLWSVRRPPRCRPLQCRELSTPENANMICKGKREPGTICDFTCDNNYFLSGDSRLTCQRDESWDNKVPRCILKTCMPESFVIEDGVVSCNNRNNIGSQCSFQCNDNYALVGGELLTCLGTGPSVQFGRWSPRSPPRCRPLLCNALLEPENGNIRCNGGNEPGTTCDFTCDNNYFLIGDSQLNCQDDESWDSVAPTCILKTCLPESFSLENGVVDCSNENNIDSECSFRCNTDYTLEGIDLITCLGTGPNERSGRWSSLDLPTCRHLVCPQQGPLRHGNFSCSMGNMYQSVCNWQCDENYVIFPENFDENMCMFDGSWNRPWPCCTLPCLPFAIVDLLIIMDSSSSVGEENWVKTTQFVSSLFDRFALQPQAAQFATFRYNRDVDTNSAIFFSNYTSNKTAFFEAFDRIPYGGSGTNTGAALEYAVNTALRIGDRPLAQNILLLITDGNSQDSVSRASRLLRESNVDVRVIPIAPPGGGKINLEDMIEIAGTRSNVIEVALERGFDALDETFAQDLAQNLCPSPCANPFDEDPVARVTPDRVRQYVNTT